MKENDIAIIGDGIMGLSFARKALKDGNNVTIYTQHPSEKRGVASSTAVGQLFPIEAHKYLSKELEDQGASYFTEWCIQTMWHVMHIDSHEWGVQDMQMAELFLSEEEVPDDIIAAIWREHKKDIELKTLKGEKFKLQWTFDSFVIAVRRYLNRLRREVLALGAIVVYANFASLDQLASMVKEKTIVDTTGASSGMLFGTGVEGVKGQVYTLPPITRLPGSVASEYSIASPRLNTAGTGYELVVGAGSEKHPTSLLPSDNLKREIGDGLATMTEVAQFRDALQQINLNNAAEVRVGLRPTRDEGILAGKINQTLLGDDRVIFHVGATGGVGWSVHEGLIDHAYKIAVQERLVGKSKK